MCVRVFEVGYVYYCRQLISSQYPRKPTAETDRSGEQRIQAMSLRHLSPLEELETGVKLSHIYLLALLYNPTSIALVLVSLLFNIDQTILYAQCVVYLAGCMVAYNKLKLVLLDGGVPLRVSE